MKISFEVIIETSEIDFYRMYPNGKAGKLSFEYGSRTKIASLINYICGVKYGAIKNRKYFYVLLENTYYWLDIYNNLDKLNTFYNGETIRIYFLYGIGDAIDDVDGIRYFYHIKESNHLPHIHAKYQGETIAINILDLKVKGTLKNKKKLREAVRYVEENKEYLLNLYNAGTNGIHVWDP